MDPIFTLQWPEFILANRLLKLLPKSKGFSILVPASRQEKGIDLAIVRKKINGKSRVITIQIKASRTYTQAPPKTYRGQTPMVAVVWFGFVVHYGSWFVDRRSPR